MDDLVPSDFHLFQNYPNPFTKKTTIKYCIPYKTSVRIAIYDSEGEMIERLVDEVKEAGTYEIEFYSEFGIRSLTSGKFFYQMKAGDYLSEKEMIIIKENMSVQSK